MAILTDAAIRMLCQGNQFHKPMLEPFIEGEQGKNIISRGLSHAGYDLRLGTKVLIFKNSYNEPINPKTLRNDPAVMNRVFDIIDDLKEGQQVWIPPHGYILGYSLEYIRMPRHLKGCCTGKSTLARCGIAINTTPIEPGWEGFLTLEIANQTPCPVIVFAGEGIAQLEFHTLFGELNQDYGQKGTTGGKYQKQGAEPVLARVVE